MRRVGQRLRESIFVKLVEVAVTELPRRPFDVDVGDCNHAHPGDEYSRLDRRRFGLQCAMLDQP